MARHKSLGMKTAPENQPDKGPYRIKRMHMQVEVEHFDPMTGKTTGISLTEPMTIFESDFFPGLMDFFKAHGLSPKE